ncbi:sensor histidine kinase [Thalassoglobus neptunius]|nr:HAMP domain-containing sensor histidine kinase [Thalassoglobus neptunius]
MATYFRRRSKIHLPITLSVSLMVLNVTLMICWIIVLAQRSLWGALTIGVVAFTLILAGLSAWLVLTLKEIGLNNRQANFVDSVTHELKSPIASLQLYLETLRMRNLSEEKRDEFHGVMANELRRLDSLISQLLEVGRLDALGDNDEPADIEIAPLLHQYAETACLNWNVKLEDVFTFEVEPVRVKAKKIVLDLVFANLVDNAVKYAGTPPEVVIRVKPHGRSRVMIQLANNGTGISPDDRKDVFQIFYRGGSELERRRKGTGLGLYIVNTLVKKSHGRIQIKDRLNGNPGCMFEIEIPNRTFPVPTGAMSLGGSRKDLIQTEPPAAS